MISLMSLRLCNNCIEELKSRGEKIHVDPSTIETVCDWCDEVDDTHEVFINNNLEVK